MRLSTREMAREYNLLSPTLEGTTKKPIASAKARRRRFLEIFNCRFEIILIQKKLTKRLKNYNILKLSKSQKFNSKITDNPLLFNEYHLKIITLLYPSFNRIRLKKNRRSET